MQVSEFILGPNRTKLPQGGLITRLRFAIPHPENRGVFIKLGRRNAMAISRLTVAVMGRLDEVGIITEIRVAPGSVTPTIGRFTPVEQALIGRKPSIALFEHAGQLAVEEMARISGRRWSSEYKEPVLAALVVQALDQVFSEIAVANPQGAR
jgi:CO/xanthine dehydrogenase FAD-binding subunit